MSVAVSPDGKQLAFDLLGDIYRPATRARRAFDPVVELLRRHLR